MLIVKIVLILLLMWLWYFIRVPRITFCKYCGVEIPKSTHGKVCDFCKIGYNLDEMGPNNSIVISDVEERRNMGTIMERNESGEVQMGETSFKVPTNRTALNVLGSNHGIESGSRYKEDGWVYIDNRRVKKWFTHVSHDDSNPVRIWHPKLDDIKTIEEKYTKVNKMCHKLWINEFQPAFNLIVELGGAHAHLTHKHTGNKDWWHYVVRTFDDDAPSISFDWVTEPRKPINLQAGQTYYAIDRRMHRYGAYVNKFKIVLSRAIARHLSKNFKDSEVGTILDLQINGRSYWYVSYRDKYNFTEWQKIAWPQNNVVTVEL